jgi:hypothetical protein
MFLTEEERNTVAEGYGEDIYPYIFSVVKGIEFDEDIAQRIVGEMIYDEAFPSYFKSLFHINCRVIKHILPPAITDGALLSEAINRFTQASRLYNYDWRRLSDLKDEAEAKMDAEDVNDAEVSNPDSRSLINFRSNSQKHKNDMQFKHPVWSKSEDKKTRTRKSKRGFNYKVTMD